MTLDQLKYFFEAARFQHIGKASKATHISPSAISAAVASLESELSVMLFDRVGKTIQLTDAGKLLQRETKELLDQFNGIKLRVTGEQNELSGQYRLGASHFLASRVLSGAWADLQKSSPKLLGEISSLSTTDVISSVVSGALDFGLCFSPFAHPDLYQETIHQGQLVIATRSYHPLIKHSLNDRKACKVLSEYPAVIHKANPGVDICENHPIFEKFGIDVHSSFLFDSDSCAVEKLTYSDAWSLLPDVVVKYHSKKIKQLSLPLTWNAPYSVSMIMRRDRLKNAVLQKIKELIIKRFERLLNI